MAAQNKDVVTTLEEFYAKAPALPKNAKDLLVQFLPWIALIFGILGIIGGLGVVGVSPLAALGGFHTAINVLIGGILTIISSVLLLMAYPGLNKHLQTGWKYSFWSEAVSLVGSLIAGSIVGGIIGALIVYYLLFQVKSYYK
ncbi:MAG TPA: hypothetical protein VMR41_00215 [Patescibacteria group bacterium]|nr:hypothetical protein [Patescibacteria group bacterium]